MTHHSTSLARAHAQPQAPPAACFSGFALIKSTCRPQTSRYRAHAPRCRAQPSPSLPSGIYAAPKPGLSSCARPSVHVQLVLLPKIVILHSSAPVDTATGTATESPGGAGGQRAKQCWPALCAVRPAPRALRMPMPRVPRQLCVSHRRANNIRARICYRRTMQSWMTSAVCTQSTCSSA